MTAVSHFPLVNQLTLRHWRADLHGGVQAAAVALPMGLAFGVVSGAGPVAGVYSAIWTGLFAALFGGTATQISGPTGPIAIVMAALFVQLAGNPQAAFAVVVLAGIMQLAFGALRLGRYINLMPYPVMSGFSSGVGCIIILMQLNPLLGQVSVKDTVSAAEALPDALAAVNPLTLAIGLVCLASCKWLPRVLRRVVPEHLFVLVVASVAIAVVGLDLPMVERPERLWPQFVWPHVTELPWRDIWVTALVLALISSIDSLVTSMAADSATRQFHDSDKELLGQGLANVVAGLLGALPGAGSTGRTMANIRAGGRTPLSGVVHSALLLVLLLTAGGLIQRIPACVLSGILIYIGLGIVDWSYIKRFPQAPRGGVAIMVVVWLVAVFISVVEAVALGVILASLALVKRMADLQLESLQISGAEATSGRLGPEEQEAFEHCGGRTLMIRLAGPLTFGAANGLTRRLANITDYATVILDFSDVPHIDESAVIALESIITRAHDNGEVVILVGLRSEVVRAFSRFGLMPMIKRCVRFRNRLDALKRAAEINSST